MDMLVVEAVPGSAKPCSAAEARRAAGVAVPNLPFEAAERAEEMQLLFVVSEPAVEQP